MKRISIHKIQSPFDLLFGAAKKKKASPVTITTDIRHKGNVTSTVTSTKHLDGRPENWQPPMPINDEPLGEDLRPF